MLQPFPAHLPIPPPQSLRLAITQLQHDRCIAQLQRPTAHSPHDFHPLQLTTAHGCPLQQDLPWLEVLVYGDISNESARGHYQRVSTGSKRRLSVAADMSGSDSKSYVPFSGGGAR